MSAWDDYLEKLGTTRPWDLLGVKSERVDETEQSQRMTICQKCPRFIKSSGQCKECGCFMKLKTKLKDATCPLHKW